MKSADQKRPLKVFLCHAHADRDPVRALYTRLTNDGVDAWLDKAKLLPGQDWEFEIRKAVREVDVVVVCLSKQFNQAGFRQKEVRLALDTAMEKPEGEIFIIPARLEECDNLESLRRWHWVDLFEDDGYEMLMRALRARAHKIGMTLQGKRNLLPKLTKPNSINKNLAKENKKDETVNSWQAILGKSLLFITDKSVQLIFALFAIVGLFYMLAVYIPKNVPIFDQALVVDMTPTYQLAVNLTNTLAPAETLSPSSTPSQKISPTSTATLLPTKITDAKGVSMALVPAGEFTMGRENGKANEKPVHQVYLNAFYMDIYEVTNAAYKACVKGGSCTPPQQTESYTRYSYYGNSQYDDYPVIYVDWNQATTFCEWRDGSLPTEAQWEKSARGTDGRTYPLGEEISCSQANFGSCKSDTTKVGSYESGKSPYGIYDMAGNVLEWVADWYDPNYYAYSPASNPLGPGSGVSRVLRGGSWYSDGYEPRVGSSNRYYYTPYYISYFVGFRCIHDITP